MSHLNIRCRNVPGDRRPSIQDVVLVRQFKGDEPVPSRLSVVRQISGHLRVLPELVQTNGHIAYTVPCLEKELEGKKVIFGPAVCDEHLTIAFIEEEGIAIEIMELK